MLIANYRMIALGIFMLDAHNKLLTCPTKKNKVNLSGYDYERDVINRTLMSLFTVFDVTVLEEVLNNSLRFSLNSFYGFFDESQEEVLASLNTLEQTGLLSIDGDNVAVDKEMRKYYEFNILKFDDNFKADLAFLKSALKRVSMHELAVWYPVSRSADDIFDALIEKHFTTPQAYQRYLEEIGFEDEVLEGIIHDVFSAPDYKIRSKVLREKHNLSRETFEYYMLHLEFNFVCCLSYNQVDDYWKEVVTPIHEYREYLRYTDNTTPQPLQETTTVQELPAPFAGFVKQLLQTLEKTPLATETLLSSGLLSPTTQAVDIVSAAVQADEELDLSSLCFQAWNKLSLLGIADYTDGMLTLNNPSLTEEWLALSDEALGLEIYRHSNNRIITETIDSDLYSHRSWREVEKNLARLQEGAWYTFSSFIEGLQAHFSDSNAITLEKKGRRWKFRTPTYSEQECSFVKAALFERYYEAGILAVGFVDEEPVFSVTALGASLLS